MDDVLKAGHCVEPESGMQDCAQIAGTADTIATKVRAVLPVVCCFLLARHTFFSIADFAGILIEVARLRSVRRAAFVAL